MSKNTDNMERAFIFGVMTAIINLIAWTCIFPSLMTFGIMLLLWFPIYLAAATLYLQLAGEDD